MNLHYGLLETLVSAYVVIARECPRSLRHGGPGVATAGDILQQSLIKRARRGVAAHIDDGGLAAYFHGFSHFTDGQRDVQCSVESCGDRDAFLQRRLESPRAYGDLVSAD